MQGDEQGCEEVGLESCLGFCCSLQEVLYLLRILFGCLFVLEQIDADEHECCKLCCGCFIVLKDDAGVAVEELEPFLIFGTQCCRAFCSVAMVQEFDEFFFEVDYHGILQELLCVGVQQSDIVGAKAWNGYSQFVVEHLEGDLELHALLVEADFHYIAYAALHRSVHYDDSVAGRQVLKWEALTDLEVLSHDCAAEPVHLFPGDFDWPSVGIAIRANGCPETLVESGIYELLDQHVCAIDEDQAAEVASEGTAVHHGVVDLVVIVIDLLLFFAGTPVYLVEGDVVFARRQESFIFLRIAGLVLLRLEHFVHECWTGMYEDVPLAAFFCRGSSTVIVVHIYDLLCPG